MRIKLNDGRYAVSLREAEEDGLYKNAYDCFYIDQYNDFCEWFYEDYYIFDYPITLLDGLGFEIAPKSLVLRFDPAHVAFEATYRYVKGWRKTPLADDLKAYSEEMYEALETLVALQRKYFFSLILHIGSNHRGTSFAHAEVVHTDMHDLKEWEDICGVFEDVCKGIADEMCFSMRETLEANTSEDYFRELIREGELWITDSGGYIRYIEDYVDE